MALDIAHNGDNILEWNEDRVHQWLSSLGFPQYEHQIREHTIRGDVLCILDAEALKAVGVTTVGQRIAILKAVYQAKLAYQVPFEPDHYIPPSEAQERSISVEKLHDLVSEQAQRVQILEDDNRRLKETVEILLDEFTQARAPQRSDEPPLKRQPSFKWAQYVNPAKSPTKPEVESPNPSPQQTEHDLSQARPPQPAQLQASTSAPASQRNLTPSSSESPVSQPLSSSSRANRQESSDNLKSFKVSLEDPTWKVLPAALKKYKINNDNWQNYAMFICYGSPGNRIERCLSYDEKPLLLFQKLKDAKKNPVFMLKHIKDIRSPIAVAQQKHALRKASVSSEHNHNNASNTSNLNPNKPVAAGQGKAIARPPRLEVSDLSAPAPPLTGTTPQAGWPEIMSPILETKSGEDTASSRDTVSSSTTLVNTGQSSTESMKSRATTAYGSVEADSARREMPPPMAGVSYAVAIYPYMAEQEDEFDVVVGDTFVILSRARGWWVVQRDPTGSGVVDTDTSKQGWVPAGCLLETNVPVASAIAEATAAAKASGSSDSPSNPESKTPILPLSIISTSFPGIALMDYKKKGEEELDLAKDDALRVFKRYNHWSYAVKEEGGDRGWVPSWFIGKVPTPGGAPPTPSTSSAPAMSNGPSVSLDADSSNQNQVSPMSSAFPMQTRNGVI
ncbi:hypothetical protein HYDPIDRAFT_30831 [Hydnomerulius pinastri MD-312]|uniref:Unplaced genomic scaffold scaffold_24, whole genome shotgun sequence n=1 Tax=Hydnomerulius pinastri MD-312 TaxID=994086 RepID=A0A0C9WCD1_9AGAM|nr:hypothetical protein HYDPIDRAFT_30831 [Hydnomerulius pinastri MD-312]